MTKLEEILETKLPVVINKVYTIPTNRSKITVFPADIGRAFKYGDNFMLFDYPELDIAQVDRYCLVKSDGSPTLSVTDAIQKTPKQQIPYIELSLYRSGGVPVSMFLIISGGAIIPYTPFRGNTVRLDTHSTLNDSGFFDFMWEDKNILEKSDLLYVMKDVNKQALIKYSLRDIYSAFQEYKDSGAESIVEVGRNLCVSEIEEMLVKRYEDLI